VQSNGSLARHQGPSTSASTPSLRTLAIDLGTKRVGLALSDEGGRWATPHEVLFVTDPAQAIEPILKLIKTEDVKRIVVGLPLNMDGTQGPATQKTIAWTTGLAASAASSSITVEILYIDERLSSFAAEQQLTERKKAGEKLTHKRKKQQLDAVAAAGFLQAFLDGKLQPIDMSRT
jgi:putative Holliday junction resolvase